MLFEKIDENGRFIDRYKIDEVPLIEVDGELVPDKNFVTELVPNDIFVSEENPPKWTGSEWVATAEPPEPLPQPPTIEERLAMSEMAILELMME